MGDGAKFSPQMSLSSIKRQLVGAENNGHENGEPSKCPGMKLTDIKYAYI